MMVHKIIRTTLIILILLPLSLPLSLTKLLMWLFLASGTALFDYCRGAAIDFEEDFIKDNLTADCIDLIRDIWKEE